MIILDEFVDFIKVIRIKMIAFYAEMSLDRFGKELRFISLRKLLILRQDSLELDFRLTELQNFPQLASDSILTLISMGGGGIMHLSPYSFPQYLRNDLS